MDVLQRIRQLLEEKGWTEYRLAKECNLSQSTISNMFTRGTAPTIPTLTLICEALHISLSQFFVEQDMEEIPLTNEQYQMFQQWSKLSPDQKQLIFELIRQMK